MATLLLRCIGPMQSWGCSSSFEYRDTEKEPTKSGILGLVCAALGRDRTESIDDLASLRMGVRVDQPGTVTLDYQTALNVAKADGSKADTQTSRRAFIADAAFLVGLEGDRALLEQINQALANPVWPLSLGRRSYLPSLPIYIPDEGLTSDSLLDALRNAKLSPSVAPSSTPLQIQLECGENEADRVRNDLPVSFAHGRRSFLPRYLKSLWCPCPQEESAGSKEGHDVHK